MKYIKLEEKEGTLSIRFHRPELHNAFNDEMISEITKAVQSVNAKTGKGTGSGALGQSTGFKNVRYVVLSGEGGSFCAGADLDWMKSMVDYSLEENRADSLRLFDMFKAIRDCPVPVISKVHGNAFGGGLGIIAASDIVAAEESTKFCFSEVKLGLVPAVISPFVAEKCSLSKMKEWMLTAKVFHPVEAVEANLINFSGTQHEVDNYIGLIAKLIKKSGPQAVSETKKLVQQLSSWDWSEKRDGTAHVIASRRVSEEGQRGLKAFFDKKSVDWSIIDRSSDDR